MKVSKVCAHCKVEFKITSDRAESAKYCCQACRTADAKHEAHCQQCGKLFAKYKSSNNTMKFCSDACYLANVKRPEKPKVEKPRYFKSCEVCEKVFRVTLTRKDTARFCSRECQGLSQSFAKECSDRQLDEKHWRWSGGEYKTHEGYIRWRRKIEGEQHITFNHRIVILKAMLIEAPDHPFLIEVNGAWKLNPEIEVHHIDRNRSNNELSNLIAVTKPAHARIHHHGKIPEPWECWPCKPTKV